MGSRKNPIWRVVVADGRSPRDGRFIETIGSYNPQTRPSTIVIDKERLQHWLDRGAQPTNTVRKLMRAEPGGASAPEAPEQQAAAPVVAEPETASAAAEPGEPAAGADGEVSDPEAAAAERAGEPAADEPAAEDAGTPDEV